MTRPVVLIRMGEPVRPVRNRVGDYTLWFQRALPEPLGVVDFRDPEDELPTDVGGYLVMGSPVSVYDPHPWMPRALELTRRLLDSGLPALGVCFGHQMFAVARGGAVERNPRGVEVGTVEVALGPEAAGDPLFAGSQGRLVVNSSHDDTVTRLPAGANAPEVLGSSALDEHAVLRWGPQTWSVQFHPEMRRRETHLAIEWRTPRLVAEGGDPEEVKQRTHDAPDGLRLLHNFLKVVRERE